MIGAVTKRGKDGPCRPSVPLSDGGDWPIVSANGNGGPFDRLARPWPVWVDLLPVPVLVGPAPGPDRSASWARSGLRAGVRRELRELLRVGSICRAAALLRAGSGLALSAGPPGRPWVDPLPGLPGPLPSGCMGCASRLCPFDPLPWMVRAPRCLQLAVLIFDPLALAPGRPKADPLSPLYRRSRCGAVRASPGCRRLDPAALRCGSVLVLPVAVLAIWRASRCRCFWLARLSCERLAAALPCLRSLCCSALSSGPLCGPLTGARRSGMGDSGGAA